MDEGGPAAARGRAGLRVVKEMFEAWHLFRGGGCDRIELLARLDPVAARLERWLRRGRRCVRAKVATFCDNLLGWQPALWKFAVCEGLAPTNNHAERMLRRGVLGRSGAFGSQSAAGCRFVERMLTATQTLRLQQRPILPWLIDALTALLSAAAEAVEGAEGPVLGGGAARCPAQGRPGAHVCGVPGTFSGRNLFRPDTKWV